MPKKKWPFAALGALTIAIGAVLTWQHQVVVELRDTSEALREENRERMLLRAENQRLAGAQVSAAELETLRANCAAVSRLREEIEKLRQRAEEMARAPVVKPSLSSPSQPEPSATEGMLPVSLWKNVGRATPVAALETALWAGAGGDLDALAETLSFDADARAKAEALFAGLPEAARMQYGSPERLIAMLTAKDIPLGSVQIHRIGESQADKPEDSKLIAQLSDTEGHNKVVLFSLHPEGDSWRIVVPEKVVEKYGNMLTAQPPTVAAAK
jgi:hypothetical protein